MRKTIFLAVALCAGLMANAETYTINNFNTLFGVGNVKLPATATVVSIDTLFTLSVGVNVGAYDESVRIYGNGELNLTCVADVTIDSIQSTYKVNNTSAFDVTMTADGSAVACTDMPYGATETTYTYMFSGVNAKDSVHFKKNNEGAQWRISQLDVYYHATESTGFQNVSSENLCVFAQNGTLHARFDGSANVKVYNAAGQMIDVCTVSDAYSLQVQKGCYIVCVNNRIRKVIVE